MNEDKPEDAQMENADDVLRDIRGQIQIQQQGSAETQLDQIKAVWQHWRGDRHRLRSSHAMVKISGILKDAEKEEVQA